MNDRMININEEPRFNKLQSLFFPIHKHEFKKFFSISFLMFCILLFYTMTRDLKDVFIQKYAVCGCTELIPVLKLWFVMPFAFLFVMLFSALVNKYGNYKTFYIIFSIFIIFYILFIFLLFPNVNHLHANINQITFLRNKCQSFMFYIIPCITNWVYTLFYVMSEILGTLSISSLFWQFANQVTAKNEVKRFFGLYALVGNIGVILSGALLHKMSNTEERFFNRNVKILIGFCILFGLLSMLTYWYINKFIVKENFNDSFNEVKDKKVKITVIDGIKLLFTDPYLTLICTSVVAFGITINFTEIIWKEHLRATFKNLSEYASTMGNLSIVSGALTIIFTMAGTYFLQNTSWRTSSLITPFVMTGSGFIFFSLITLQKSFLNIFNFSTAIFVLWVGLILDALLKAVKFCLFDPTKSMAFIPLNKDRQTKGRAAVELIGGRSGKASASLIIYTFTNIIYPASKIMEHFYTIIPIFFITTFIWILSVFYLSRRYEKIKQN